MPLDDTPIHPEVRALLDAVRDCPARGPVVDRPNPSCRCGGTILCTRDTRVVHDEDCNRCQAAALGIS